MTDSTQHLLIAGAAGALATLARLLGVSLGSGDLNVAASVLVTLGGGVLSRAIAARKRPVPPATPK